ncbi:MAG: TPR end-of-group domain-containing protein [Terriglobales bacterium]
MEETVQFAGYRFDRGAGRLWRGQNELRLTPKASAVLKILVANAGNPVSKDELFATVWGGTAVTDDALTSCIQELRKAFADNPRQPNFIETRHRLGYRFVAQLSLLKQEPTGSVEGGGHAVAIAVLPFADMSRERDQNYLCEGLAEELINALTRVDGLNVAARTASFRFSSNGADVTEIGRKLGVGTLLEGSVRKSGDRLRITVQLIDTATGYHRWSQRFDRMLVDVLAVQDEIAENVATSLRGSVLAAAEKPSLFRPRTQAAAYEYYLRGRQHLHRMTEADLRMSSDFFESALGEDANYAPAWACMTAAHGTLYEWFGANEEDLLKADRASRRALELSPNMSEAHLARGFALSLSGEYEQARPEFEAAIRLNPNLFEAYYYFARASFAAGNVELSADLFGKAAEMRSDDYQSPMLRSLALRILGRKQEARDSTREGIRRAEHALLLQPNDGRALSLGSCALFDDGQTERAFEWSRRALELYPDDMSAIVNGACLHARAGHKDEALNLLERAFARGWGKRDWIEHDPDYDVLRDDPRFQNLIAKLK